MNHGYTKRWSDHELQNLGFHKVVVGIPGRPLPVMVPNPEATSTEDAYRLESIEDSKHPIVIWSQRPYDEVIGLLYRLLPTPSMLPLFYETLQLLQVENERRIQFYIGKHGSGKSFLGKLIGDLLHPDGAISVNCADRDLNELLFETVLDVQANPDLYSKINQKLREGSLNSTSVAALKTVVGEAFKTNEGVPHIDFEQIGGSRLESIETEEGLTETQVVFSNANTQAVVETLLKIAQVEGLSKEAAFMPIRSQLGVLPRVWKEGRVVHLEEYNKCKEGSDTCLHPVLQVFNGENLKCRVYGTGGMSFSFDNHDRLPGFFCYLDGNMQADGVATHTLSASANDRILPNIIQDMIREDWQHRWSQLLTGLPIKILYDSKRDQWDADPSAFTRFLHMIRGLGNVEVPPSHRHYIDRWEDVLDATEIISRYNKLYDEMTNPDSDSNREGKFPELFAEVDEEFYNMAGGSMRRNIYYFKMALLGRPATIQPQFSQGYDFSADWSMPPQVEVDRETYNPAEKLGSNIAEIFFRDMVRLTLGLGKIHLYTRLKAACESLRIVKPDLKEGEMFEGVYLEDLLNSQGGKSDQNRELQTIFCARLRQHLPANGLSAIDDHLMTADQIGKALQKAHASSPEKTKEGWLGILQVQQFNPLSTVENLIGPAYLVDGGNPHQAKIETDRLLEHDDFLLSLSLPLVGKRNLAAAFTSGLLGSVNSALAASDEALLITANRSSTSISMSTVKVSHPSLGSCLVHLLRDSKRDLTLVVGEDINENHLSILKQAGIEYTSRNAHNARTKIQTFLNRLFVQASPETEAFCCVSFLMRCRPEGFDVLKNMDRIGGMKLADLLSASKSESRYPVYATRFQSESEVKACLKPSIPAQIPS